jgi:hypothetical protein
LLAAISQNRIHLRPGFFDGLERLHNQQSVEPDPIAEPELPVNSKLDDEIRKFEFKRRFEKIQFQVREEFKSEAAKLALELWRSKPLADALSQPGPCDGDLHSKIMPWRQA